MKTTLTCLIASGLLLAAALARGATVPGEVNYQGQLLSAAGQPLTTGNYTLTFTIYSAPTDGSVEWGPYTNTAVAVVDGSFNVVLPAQDYRGTNFVDTVSSSPRYLELKVGDNPPIAPRQQLLSAPYALNAERFQGHDWGVVFDNADPATGKIPGGRIADASITAGQLADGAVSAAKIDPAVGVWNKSGNHIVYNAGWIGIGTSTPDSILDISGVLKISTVRDYWSTIFHNLYWGGDPATWRNTAQGPGTLVNLAGGVNHPSSFLVQVSPLSTTEPPGSDAALINAFRIVSNGNVGIGAWDPASKLDIRSGPGRQISANDWVDLSGSSNGSGLLGGNMYLDAWPTAWKYSITHSSIGAMGFAVNYPSWNQASVISSGTSSSTAGQAFTPSVIATFTSGGNVGIGTSSPSDKLHVNGSLRATTGSFDSISASSFSGSFSGNGASLTSLRANNITSGTLSDSRLSSNIPRENTANIFTASQTVYGDLTCNALYVLYGTSQRLMMWPDSGGGSSVYVAVPPGNLNFIFYANGKFGCSGIANISDLRFKNNITPIDGAMEKVSKLRGVVFEWKQDNTQQRQFPEGKQIGLIAQEVEQVVPEVVQKDSQNGDSVNYAGLVPLLIEGAKEHQQRLELQRHEIQTLKEELELLKNRLRDLIAAQ
ncbi:MAG: tail fiber domain-containing protein [Verrucomicrobia bacterium]|nr:tail fiber domain-containing protein [Verrucomicrobiota bacterium]